MKKSFLSILTAAFLLLSFVLPVHAAESVTVSLRTDAESYKQSDTISVTGTVLKGTKAGKGTNPTLQVKNSSGKTVETYQWKDTQISSSGSISTTIKPKKYVDDTYTIHLSASGATAVSKKIVISGEEVKKATITVLTDKNEYIQGETVLVTGVVQHATEKVILSVEKDGKKLVNNKEVTAGTNGSYSFSYDTKDAVIGSYKVTVNVNSSATITAEKTFKVNAKTEPTPPANPGPGTPTPTPDPGTTTPVPGTPTPNPGTTNPEPTPTPKPGDIIPKPVDPTLPVEPSPVPDTTVKPYAPKVNKVTSVSTVITGTADAGTTIIISDRKNFRVWADANSSGVFSIKLSQKLKAGMKLYATAKAGEKESDSTELVVQDATPPAAPSVSKVTDKITKVTGTSEAGAKITIKAGKKLIGSGTADKKGKFSIKMKLQKAGTILTVTAADQAGNVSKSKTVKVLDKTAPKAPSVNAVKKTATKVTGKAEAGAKVYVKAGKKVIGSATVSKKGAYSVKIKKQKAGTKLAVYAKDQAGNIGKTKTVTVKK